MTTEILIVDDQLHTARNTADYLQARVSWAVEYTDDVTHALDVVRNGSVKVAVLDQRMEEGVRAGITGLDLFSRMHEEDPRVRCIIFSGQSRERDLRNMLSLQTRSLDAPVRFLDKDEIAELPGLVNEVAIEYVAGLARDHARRPEPLGSYKERRAFRQPSVRFELLGVEDVSASPSPRDKDYRTGRRLEGAGSYTFVSADESEIELEHQESTEIDARALFRAPVLAALSAELSAKLRDQLRVSAKRRITDSTTVQATLDSAPGVVSQTYQRAPIYQTRRAIVRVICECCGDDRIVTRQFREWTGRFHHRRLDVDEDGRKSAADLGIS